MKIESSNNIISQLLECGLITYDEEEIEEMDEKELQSEIKHLSQGLSTSRQGAYEVEEFDGSWVSHPFSWEGEENTIIIWEKYEELEDFIKQELANNLTQESTDFFDYEFLVNNGFTVMSEDVALESFADEQREYQYENWDMNDLINTYTAFYEEDQYLEDKVSALEDKLEVEEATQDAIEVALDASDPEPLQDWYISTFNVSKIPKGDSSKAPKILLFFKIYDKSDEDYTQGLSLLEALSDDDVEIDDREQVETYISLLQIIFKHFQKDFQAIQKTIAQTQVDLQNAESDLENFRDDGTLPDGSDGKYKLLYEEVYDSEFLQNIHNTVFEIGIDYMGFNLSPYEAVERFYGGVDYEAYANHLVDENGVDDYLPSYSTLHECGELFYYYDL